MILSCHTFVFANIYILDKKVWRDFVVILYVVVYTCGYTYLSNQQV